VRQSGDWTPDVFEKLRWRIARAALVLRAALGEAK